MQSQLAASAREEKRLREQLEQDRKTSAERIAELKEALATIETPRKKTAKERRTGRIAQSWIRELYRPRRNRDDDKDRSNIMYYVIETKYVGANPYDDGNIDASAIEIRTSPAAWTGSYGDEAVYEHGDYQTLDEALDAIVKKFGEVRDCDHAGDAFESHDEAVVAIFKRGKYAPMSSRATADWAYERIQADIDADTTDERIAELVSEYEDDANCYGGTLHRDLEEFMLERRAELRDEEQT